MATVTFKSSSGELARTAGHPIYSLDRCDYVDLGSLTPGEHVRAADGWATAEAMARWWGHENVHNLEVDVEHRFFVGSTGVEGHNAGTDDEWVRVRHYTSKSGAASTERDQVIRAYDEGSVFAESERRRPMSPADMQKTYGVQKGKGACLVETDVPQSRVQDVKNPRTGNRELKIKGDVPLENATIRKNDGLRNPPCK